jgi:uroporphyrinogen-III decarboxylase
MGLAFRVGESDGPVTSSHREVLTELAERQSTIMARVAELAPSVEIVRAAVRDEALMGGFPFPLQGFEFEAVWTDRAKS